jgi:hypothetical protein
MTRQSASVGDLRSCGARTSRHCREYAKELGPVHDPSLGKSSSGEGLSNVLLWLTGVGCKSERDLAPIFEHAPYLFQSTILYVSLLSYARFAASL